MGRRGDEIYPVTTFIEGNPQMLNKACIYMELLGQLKMCMRTLIWIDFEYRTDECFTDLPLHSTPPVQPPLRFPHS